MSYPKTQFFLYLFLILIGSSIPGESVPTVFAYTWDKLLHVIEYFYGFLCSVLAESTFEYQSFQIWSQMFETGLDYV